MHISLPVILSLLTATAAAGPVEALEARAAVGTKCSYSSSLHGTCQHTADCGDMSFAGLCPGAADIQCCIKKACTGPGGHCKNTYKGCYDGVFQTNLCPGNSGIQCCHY